MTFKPFYVVLELIRFVICAVIVYTQFTRVSISEAGGPCMHEQCGSYYKLVYPVRFKPKGN